MSKTPEEGTSPRRRISLRSDTLIATAAVILFTVVVSSIVIVLSWVAYDKRYGIGFWDFLMLAF